MKEVKFKNLRAEQAKRGYTDEVIANLIGMKRSTYSYKKRRGEFKASECVALCRVFDVSFEYLFEAERGQ